MGGQSKTSCSVAQSMQALGAFSWGKALSTQSGFAALEHCGILMQNPLWDHGRARSRQGRKEPKRICGVAAQ